MDFLKKLYSLEGYRIIVTGASGGLGLNQAITLAKCGATVIALSRSGKVKDGSTTEVPENVHFDTLDIANEASVKQKMEQIGEEGGIDVLVNNAGITMRVPAEDVTSEQWDNIHNTNVKGMFFCCKYAFPYLSKSEFIGRIINISSMAAYMGFSEVMPYVSSKTSVLGLTRGLAVDWREKNILINSVSPGWFPSEMNKQVMDPERNQKILNKIALNRYGRPEELSAMICFLASPAASYIHGQDYSVDGGALTYGY